jgi:hypothetical protein
MKAFVFAALTVNAIIWGAAAGALRPSVHEHLAIHEHLAMRQASAAWSMAEPVAAPDLSIAVW